MSSPESLKSEGDIKRILVLIRHGEKVVKTGKIPKCGKFDSELSPLGITQAYDVGQSFISQLKKYNFTRISPGEIHIISSPYICTLQTTSHFIRGISS